MTLPTKALIAFGIACSMLAIAMSFASFHVAQQKQQNVGADVGFLGFTQAATSTSKVASGTASDVIATSTGRVALSITNASSTGGVFCNANLGRPAATSGTGSGLYIAPNATLLLSPETTLLYRGAVSCITTGGNATLSVYERQ